MLVKKLDKFYLESRLPSNIQYFNGTDYKSIVSVDEDKIEHINWDMLSNEFKLNMFWKVLTASLVASLKVPVGFGIFGMEG